MRRLMLAATGLTTFMFAPAALAATVEPVNFDRRASVFEAADMNDDNMLSRQEYLDLRMHTIDDRWVRSWRSDMADDGAVQFNASFATMDRDSSGWVSASEFANAPAFLRASASTATSWSTAPGWDPEYMTVTYYLMANPIDAEVVEGKPVVNLEGEDVGTIDEIIRTDKGGYYALIDLEGGDLYPSLTSERDRAGVPLDDLLLYSSSNALMLSTRGEEWLRDADARELEREDYEFVDTLYAI